jgi:hypothetical protein
MNGNAYSVINTPFMIAPFRREEETTLGSLQKGYQRKVQGADTCCEIQQHRLASIR